MWHRGTRGLSTVGCVGIKGHLKVADNIFPNVRFGFNQKKLLVGTLPVGIVYSTIDLSYLLGQKLSSDVGQNNLLLCL